MTNLPINAKTERGEHGVLRDDGQKDRPQSDAVQYRIDEGNNPVLDPRDERFPNAPDMLNADKGARSAEETANRETMNTQEFDDAYSENDPGVETKA